MEKKRCRLTSDQVEKRTEKKERRLTKVSLMYAFLTGGQAVGWSYPEVFDVR